LENNYQLCYSFLPDDADKFFLKIDELLGIKNLKSEFKIRRERLLSEKIDVTAFYVWFIENYPKSVEILKENPEFQNNFK